MGKHEWKTIGITLVLLAFGFFVSWFVGGNDPEKQITLFIAFVALIYPIIKAIEASYDKNRIRKMKIVTGKTYDDLEIEINREFANNLKGKNIISVEIVNAQKAVIIYY